MDCHGAGLPSLAGLLWRELLLWFPLSLGAVCVASAIVTGAPPWSVFNGEYPFAYEGDGLAMLSLVQKGLEGSYLYNARLGYPFGADFFDYPMSDMGSLLTLKALGHCFGSSVVALKLYFLLGFGVTVPFAYGTLRVFGLCRALAASGTLLFVFLPFHFARIAHPLLAWYFVVPLFIHSGYRLFVGAPLFSNDRRFWCRTLASGIGLCVLASFGVYYAAFGAIVLCVSGLLGALVLRENRILLCGAGAAIAVVAGVVVNVAPNLWYEWEFGPNPEGARRIPAESERFGLKLTQMVLPAAWHRVAPLRDVAQRYRREFPLVNENESASLGMVGSVGLFLSVAAVFWSAAGRRVDQRMVFLGLLSLGLFLVATVGGAGVLFALLVSPMIRAWNRVSIFVAFSAIATFFLHCEYLLTRYASTGRRSLLALGCAVVVGVLALWDETPPTCAMCNEEYHRRFIADREFVGRIEASLPVGAAIYQLPYVAFPEAGVLHGLQDYAMVVGFLHSGTLRWSYGAMRGREGDMFYRYLSQEPMADQVAAIQRLGFGGVYVDRRGFPDKGEAVERELRRLLGGGPTLVHPDNTIAFYQLLSGAPVVERKMASREIMDLAGFHADKFGVRVPATLRDGIDFRKRALPLFVAEIDGLAPPEPWGRWSDARVRRSVKIQFVDPLPREFSLVLKVAGFGPNIGQPLLVSVGGVSVSVPLSEQMSEHRIKLSLPDHLVRTIELTPPQPISPAELKQGDDARLLGVGIEEMGFEL